MAGALGKKTAELVYKVLKANKKSRDNDRYIQAAIWVQEAKALGLESSNQFINAYFKGKLTDPNAVSRVRKKLQEMHEELRGEKYETRQEEYEESEKK